VWLNAQTRSEKPRAISQKKTESTNGVPNECATFTPRSLVSGISLYFCNSDNFHAICRYVFFSHRPKFFLKWPKKKLSQSGHDVRIGRRVNTVLARAAWPKCLSEKKNRFDAKCFRSLWVFQRRDANTLTFAVVHFAIRQRSECTDTSPRKPLPNDFQYRVVSVFPCKSMLANAPSYSSQRGRHTVSLPV